MLTAIGKLSEAADFANQTLQEEDASVRPDALRIMGTVLLRMDENKAKAAEEYILESIDLARQNKDRYLEAYGYRALAEVYQVQRRDEDVSAAFDQAISIFEELKLDKEAKKTNVMINSS